jgi:predicted dienelactone hydrolase
MSRPQGEYRSAQHEGCPMNAGLTRRRAIAFAVLGRAVRCAYTSATEVIEFDWVDAARSRAVPVRLYWPHAATPGAKVPLVLFSHGIGGSRRGYSYLGQHWATHGYASLHVQHVGSDREPGS